MKKLIILSLAVLISGGAMAAKKKEVVNKNKPVFTTVVENKISSIKDQSRSGTCWNYSTLSYFESEILKKSGKEYNLCEMFVCNKTYMDRAIQVYIRFLTIGQENSKRIPPSVFQSVSHGA